MSEEYDFLPTMNDIEYWKTDETHPERKEYYSQFGWEKLVVPVACTNVNSRMEWLKTLFVQRYGFRRVNAETMPRWQIRLQNTFDAEVEAAERAYKIYDEQSAAMESDIIRGQKIVNSGSDSSENESRRIDTPDTAVNDSDDYADEISKNEGSVTYGKEVSMTLTGNVVADVNRALDEWRDLDVNFISKFENLFLNVFDDEADDFGY